MVILAISKIVRDFSEAYGRIPRSRHSRFARVLLIGFLMVLFHLISLLGGGENANLLAETNVTNLRSVNVYNL